VAHTTHCRTKVGGGCELDAALRFSMFRSSADESNSIGSVLLADLSDITPPCRPTRTASMQAREQLL
jgi:hypothetical protein